MQVPSGIEQVKATDNESRSLTMGKWNVLECKPLINLTAERNDRLLYAHAHFSHTVAV